LENFVPKPLDAKSYNFDSKKSKKINRNTKNLLQWLYPKAIIFSTAGIKAS
jgi:hypothetical protein